MTYNGEIVDDKLPKSKWQFNSLTGAQLFNTIDAMIASNGYRPSQDGFCEPDEDVELLVAFHSRKNLMSSYEQHVQNEEAKSASKK